MIVLLLLWAALGATLYTLASTHPPIDAFVRWAAATAIICVIGGLMIRAQPLGEATILGRIGGAFVRWGYRAGQGKLPPAVIISWLVWLVIGAAAIWALHFRNEVRPLVLTLGWASQVLLLFYLVGMWLANAGADSHFRNRFITMAGMVLLLLATSVVLWFKAAGTARGAAVILAAIPLGAALIYGIFVAVLMLVGGKARWN
jgi:hypothetical protein